MNPNQRKIPFFPQDKQQKFNESASQSEADFVNSRARASSLAQGSDINKIAAAAWQIPGYLTFNFILLILHSMKCRIHGN